MDVTIVISNFNYVQYVGSAIKSCLCQTYPCKIIVVDDNSTDDSWKVINQYVSEGILAVRLRENSNGNARGKNVGIALSKTSYVTCIDSDDMLLPDSIESRMLFTPEIGFIHGWAIPLVTTEKYDNILKNTDVLQRKFQFNKRQIKLLGEQKTRWTWAIQASTVLARRSLYEIFGLYDEKMRWSIDREMWWRWLSHGVTESVIQKFVSIYRHHSKQLTKDKTRKDPKLCSKMLKDCQVSRTIISSSNTILMSHYDPYKYIGTINE